MNITLNISEESYRMSQSSRADGRWTNQEHELFLEGLKVFGKNWKRIQSIVKTRTGSQIRSHAQKFFQKISHKKRSDLSEESSQVSQQKSFSTVGSQNQPEYSQLPSIQGMICELKNTLNFIESTGINPLDTFSHYFFEIIKHPQELINNNFYGYFVDIDWSSSLNKVGNSMAGSKTVSFQPIDLTQNLQSLVCLSSN